MGSSVIRCQNHEPAEDGALQGSLALSRQALMTTPQPRGVIQHPRSSLVQARQLRIHPTEEVGFLADWLKLSRRRFWILLVLQLVPWA